MAGDRQALLDAFEAMNAACKWAAGETAGIKTVADADRHMAGYDALLAATVKAGQAAGVLSGGVASEPETRATPEATADAASHIDRLQEAIEGERRFWHTVEVRPDDLSAVLEYVAVTIAELRTIPPAAIRAAEPPALDVERLADAMQRLQWGWLAWTDHSDPDPRRLQAFRNAAVNVAAEYARLQPDPETT